MEHVSVSTIPTKRTRWVIEVAYAYQVASEVYGNTERRFFLSPDEPRSLEGSLKQTGVRVRYDPAQPARSFMDLPVKA